jgi:hypothetical protein
MGGDPLPNRHSEREDVAILSHERQRHVDVGGTFATKAQHSGRVCDATCQHPLLFIDSVVHSRLSLIVEEARQL